MKIEEQEIDLKYLEHFNLPTLCNLHDEMMGIIIGFKKDKEFARVTGRIKDASVLEAKIHFLSINLSNIEVVMMGKESDVFTTIGGFEICRN